MTGKPHPGLAFFLCCLAALAEGYDLQSAGLTAPKFAPLFHLDPAHLNWIFTANTFGLLLGAIIGGRMADSVGRRWILIASMALFGLFSVATALSPDSATLIAMRFLTGLGLGGALPNLVALTAETGSPERASMRVTMLAAAMPFGGGTASALLILVHDISWQAIFWVGGIAPLLIAAAMLPFLPESPAFRRDQARVGVIRALSENGGTVRTPLLWASLFCTSMVLYILLNWLPSLLVAKGFARTEAAMVAFAFTLGGGIGGLVLGPLARIRARRMLYAIIWAGMAAGMTWLGLVGHDIAAGCAAGLAIGFFVVGGQFLLYGLSSELYPVATRGTGVGFAAGVGRLGSIAGPLYAATVLVASHSANIAFVAVVPVIALGLAAALPLLGVKPVEA